MARRGPVGARTTADSAPCDRGHSGARSRLVRRAARRAEQQPNGVERRAARDVPPTPGCPRRPARGVHRHGRSGPVVVDLDLTDAGCRQQRGDRGTDAPCAAAPRRRRAVERASASSPGWRLLVGSGTRDCVRQVGLEARINVHGIAPGASSTTPPASARVLTQQRGALRARDRARLGRRAELRDPPSRLPCEAARSGRAFGLTEAPDAPPPGRGSSAELDRGRFVTPQPSQCGLEEQVGHWRSGEGISGSLPGLRRDLPERCPPLGPRDRGAGRGIHSLRDAGSRRPDAAITATGRRRGPSRRVPFGPRDVQVERRCSGLAEDAVHLGAADRAGALRHAAPRLAGLDLTIVTAASPCTSRSSPHRCRPSGPPRSITAGRGRPNLRKAYRAHAQNGGI